MGVGAGGCAAPGFCAMDHTAPWFLPNNGLFNWDMNVQMTWWLASVGGRTSIVEALLGLLEAGVGQLAANAGAARLNGSLAGASGHTGYYLANTPWHHCPKSEDNAVLPPGPLGDLLWAVADLVAHWELTGNTTVARRAYPFLRGSVQFCVHWLREEPDGLYHTPPTWSPEYLDGPGGGDTTYDLALCRWGLDAALRLSAALDVAEPLAPVWRARLARLAPYATDPSRGLNVARGLPFVVPHRHFSHLMPLLLRGGAAVDPALEARSLDNWAAMARPPASAADPGWCGFSYCAAAVMSARLGRGRAAAGNVTYAVENSAPLNRTMNARMGSVLFHNTFYGEGYGDPTHESALCTHTRCRRCSSTATWPATAPPR